MNGRNYLLGLGCAVAFCAAQPASATVSLIRVTAQVDPFVNLYTERKGYVQDDGLNTRILTSLQSIDLLGDASANSGGATASDTARIRFNPAKTYSGNIAIDLAVAANLLAPTDQVLFTNFGQLIYRFRVDTPTPFTIDYASIGAAGGAFSFMLRGSAPARR